MEEIKKVAKKGDFVDKKDAKKQKETKKPKKDKRPNIFKRFGAKCKDVFSELKKVSWPTFPKVLKQTGIVLAVVVIFLVVITAFDYGLASLVSLVGIDKA